MGDGEGSDPFTLGGRHALVTGAGQGIGRCIALTFAEHGAGTIVVNDLFQDRADAVAAEIRDAGGRAVAVAADVTDLAAVEAMAEVTRQLDAPVQVLVNNAGLPPGPVQMMPFLETEPAQWEPMLRLNLYGVLQVTRTFAPAMVEAGWGRVITMISDASRVGDPFQAVYAAAKAGAAGFSRSLASEIGKRGVTVNCIALATVLPGYDPAVGLSDDMQRRFKPYAMRRPGRPEDVAPTALLLASEAGQWITGQVYPVNGGYSYAL
ncbi:MAG TPA: SDR family NAD(P)-dependent oxidoreductase [Acidimicrobiales bacterium]